MAYDLVRDIETSNHLPYSFFMVKCLVSGFPVALELNTALNFNVFYPSKRWLETTIYHIKS